MMGMGRRYTFDSFVFISYDSVPDEIYRVAFRKRIYNNLDELQEGLDTWIIHYNEERTHNGKYCFEKTLTQTLNDSLQLAKEKIPDKIRRAEPVLLAD